MNMPKLKLPPRRRRTKPMPEGWRNKCIDYYERTHSARALAAMLVDLEWAEGHVPPEEEP